MKFRILSLIALLLVLCLSFCSCDLSDVPDIDDGIDAGDGELPENPDSDGDNTEEGNGNQSGSQGGSGSTDNGGDQSGSGSTDGGEGGNTGTGPVSKFDLSLVPAYSGNEYYIINDNIPFFTDEEKVTKSYETYGARDSLGRCTYTVSCIGRDIMPAPGEERGDIGSVKPTGWIQASYSCISGGYLYNRCHIIGWQLTAENANWENLVTGTRYMNEAMIPFESMVADYIKETDNHVMYRATPIFAGDNLLCSGILLEAFSVEDDGDGICFNIFLYNVQPEIELNYATGASKYVGADSGSGDDTVTDSESEAYVLNTSSKKVHIPTCGSLNKMADNNRKDVELTEEEYQELLEEGYTACGNCHAGH